MSKKNASLDELPLGYEDILNSISSKIKSAQARTVSAASQEFVKIYREIGKTIYEQQESGEWEDTVVKTLASDLQKAFPGIKDFSCHNLYTMRDQYTSYRSSKKLQTLSAKINWSKKVAPLYRYKKSRQREFYIKVCKWLLENTV